MSLETRIEELTAAVVSLTKALQGVPVVTDKAAPAKAETAKAETAKAETAKAETAKAEPAKGRAAATSKGQPAKGKTAPAVDLVAARKEAGELLLDLIDKGQREAVIAELKRNNATGLKSVPEDRILVVLKKFKEMMAALGTNASSADDDLLGGDDLDDDLGDLGGDDLDDDLGDLED